MVFLKSKVPAFKILQETINTNSIRLLRDSDHVVLTNNKQTALSRLFFPEKKFATNPQSAEKY